MDDMFPSTTHVRLSAPRGQPLGDEGWVELVARPLNLELTLRPPESGEEEGFDSSKKKSKRPDPWYVLNSIKKTKKEPSEHF